MDKTLDYTRANGASWDGIAHTRSPQPPEFFVNGGTTLDDVEVEQLPDVQGRRLLHLACAGGNESLSWAARGASVTGVDISAVAVDLANENARATGLDARFVAADMYQLPEDLGDFDVVYASWGVICWLPDLDRWARIVVDHLRRGGTFLLCEHHPIWEVLGVRGDGTVAVTVDYFGRGNPTADTYDTAKRPSGSTAETVFSAFVWPVSDVVMRLARAGLRIEEFTEMPVPGIYDGLGSAASRLPAIYIVKAAKP